ncbi:phosphoenolpyruvate--protein phosphotransferase [Microcella pacifica]|uniref:Phosphocarrier protein HPr n=1 Tax=Microcella pacifica TaxID=2591847 RepID=A0A9E5JQR1_9MICO|nr:phosphoenolpyruvate--protein phosphotransferase [Microcella pacifica]NHF63142.1 phosphoenolpyruvate--protein phosphotransferase [Microcella pacifica]
MSPVGVVAVSHSPALAEAAIALALEMTSDGGPAIAAAAGTADGGTGTDAARIAAAIAEVDSGDGVVVIMDLGSAIMSAELALEFVDSGLVERVRLVAAPFVEGLLAAVVRAAGGAALDEVAEEASGALRPKLEHLGGQSGGRSDEPGAENGAADAQANEPDVPDAEAQATVRNVAGLHARPASVIAGIVPGFDAEVTLAVGDRPPVSAASPIGIATLAAGPGTLVRIAARGLQAGAAVEEVRRLIEEGFGEELADLTAAGAPSASEATATAALAPAERRGTGPLGVSAGRVIGPVVVLRRSVSEPDAAERLPEDELEAALAEAAEARERVAVDYEARAASVSGERRTVLEATAAMARDDAWAAGMEPRIRRSRLTPARATWETADDLAGQYRRAGGVFAERVTDLLDVRNRVLAAITGEQPPGVPERREPYILVADDLAPADTVTLDPAICLAIVTEQGGPTSHTAIIARELGLPAVVGRANATSLVDGTLVLVDGETGEVLIDPDATAQATATGVLTTPPFVGPGATSDGHRVVLGSNVGAPRDVARAVERGAEGVGLFRTEFCFLDRDIEPSIPEQVAEYRQVFAAFPDQRVVVRTLDAGSDKPLPFLTADDEPNPALGVRGVRTARRNPDVLERQLAAIAEAAQHETAEIWVMAPMIATLAETQEFAARARGAGIGTVGVMIETPAAALTASELMGVVDFVSIGTNDLAQYTLAADRVLGDLADLADPWQPALLRLIGLVGEAGSATATPVGVCGEAAAEPALGAVLVGLGVTSLSMAARAITPVGRRLAELSIDTCRSAAAAATAASDAHGAREAALAILG